MYKSETNSNNESEMKVFSHPTIVDDIEHLDDGFHPLMNYSNDDFKYELDLGLALPFRYNCSDEDLKKIHAAKVAKNIDTTGKIKFLKVTTQSDEGPLQAVENDVLLALLTMAYDQRHSIKTYSFDNDIQTGTRVYFTYAEICRRLGIDSGNSGRVKKAIQRIKSQKLSFKQWDYSPGSDKFHDQSTNTSIILRDGDMKVSRNRNVDTFQQVYYVDLDPFIVNNLFKNYFSTIDQSQYLALPAGSARRLLIFLQSKKKNYGDNFTFELEEIIQILGYDSHERPKRAAMKVLEKVHKSLGNFDYTITEKRKGYQYKSDFTNYTVLICFKETIKMIPKYEPFYQALCDWYGEDVLQGADILEIDVISTVKEITSKYSKETGGDTTYKFNKNEINAGEFIVDVVLFQKFTTNYKVESFKGFCKAMGTKLVSGIFELPDRYRLFVVGRLEDKKKNMDLEILTELQNKKRHKEEEEEKLFDESYSKLFNEMIMTSETTKKIIGGRASEQMNKEKIELERDGIFEGSSIYKAEHQRRMYSIGKEMFISGELTEIRGGSNKAISGTESSKKLAN